MSKVLVIGSNGQLGAALVREGQKRGHVVIRAARTDDANLKIDLEQNHSLAAAATIKPDVIFIAAGYTFVDKAEDEPERVRQINAAAPGILAQQAAANGCKLVYYSTDYVFNGDAGNYDESSATDPTSVYGRTKLEGEHAVLAAAPENLVLRTSVVYGPDDQKKNFVYQVLRAHAEGRSLRLPRDQISNPTYNPDLAAASYDLVEKKAGGILHAVGEHSLARTDLANLIGRIFAIDVTMSEIDTAELNQKAKRPLNAQLNTERLVSILGRPLWGAEKGLRHFKEHFR